jgi:Tfp pilus assembly protein PilF
MRYRHYLVRSVLAGLMLIALAGSVAAQGRITGETRDESGQPIKGATVECTNPNVVPNKFTATTDDKGRFVLFGLAAGRSAGAWSCVAGAPGYMPSGSKVTVDTTGKQSPLNVVLKKGSGDAGALAGITSSTAKELQADLQAADQLFNAKQWDAAIEKYKAILAKAPSLTVISLQVAAAYRNKKEYDNAIAVYNDMLKADPNNDKAKVGVGMTNLEKGDLKAADEALSAAALAPGASREVLYNLGEVKFAKGESEEAGKWYQKATDLDPTWGKPLLKLAMVALNKGDKDGAAKLLEKTAAVDPASSDAAAAKAMLAELQK